MGKSFGVHDTIVHVPRESAGFHFQSELGVDHGLEGSRRICHSEEHNQQFKQPFRG
jgi:hypothetical protein